MSIRWVGCLMALALAGCASTADPGAAAPARPSSGDWAVSIAGTPFLLAFRSVVCVSSVVVAAPFSAVFALADAPEGLDTLGEGVSQNCAGPYILRPSDVS